MSYTLKVKGFASRKDGFFILIFTGLLLLVVLVQQLLPSNQPVPFARINGNIQHIDSRNDILSSYRVTEERELTLKINDYTATYRLKDLGVALDEQPTIQPYIVESRFKRLIPFSVLAQIYRDNKPAYTSSKNSLYIVTSAIADQVNVQSKNAEINVASGLPTIRASIDGVLFEPQKATFAIFDAIEKNIDQVSLTSKSTEPDITTSELEQATLAFTATIPETLTINIGTQSKSLTQTTMYTWLAYSATDSKPVISFDKEKLSTYAQDLSNQFAASEQPTITTVSLTDGKETGRIPGKAGKSIVANDLATAITSAINDNRQIVETKLVDVPSPIKYARNYTRSSAGLQDLLGQITTGKEISIRYVDINGRGWDVGSREHTKSNMASTYKMFVTYSVLKRIDDGSMKFSDNVNGKTVDACLQTIIIDSNNECAIALAEQIGWIKVQNEGIALGAQDLDWSKELIGSAFDASIIPIKLARGEILTETSRNYMLDLMKRQRFRSGIPSGTPHVVADKVGFIDGWLNDAGIVYAPDMTYVLVVYTKGQSWSTIAEITRQIETLAQ